MLNTYPCLLKSRSEGCKVAVCLNQKGDCLGKAAPGL